MAFRDNGPDDGSAFKFLPTWVLDAIIPAAAAQLNQQIDRHIEATLAGDTQAADEAAERERVVAETMAAFAAEIQRRAAQN